MLSRCSTRSRTQADDPRGISSIVSARRRVLARRCGTLPPRGLVTRNHTKLGHRRTRRAVYRHTELGRLVARILDVPLGNYVSSVYTASADWRVVRYRVVSVQPTAGSRGRGTRVRCRHSRP